MKVGDKVKYDGEKHLVVNILKDGSPVLVPTYRVRLRTQFLKLILLWMRLLRSRFRL
jgi:hypothetical protein